VIKEE